MPSITPAPDLGSRIKELREHLGLSQEAFGRLFGRSWKQVSAWENGRQAPPVSVLERAAEAQGWPVEIFERDGPRPAAVVRVGSRERLTRQIFQPGGTEDETLGEAMSPEEEQIRSMLRNIERTVRAHVANPDLFSAEETRINQTAIVRQLIRQRERAGDPVPSWLTRLYEEVLGGPFR